MILVQLCWRYLKISQVSGSFETQCIETFAVSHTVFEKFDVKQSNDLEICPRSLTVVSPKSCRVAMYVKCSKDSERKKRKPPFSTTPLSFDAPSPANLREYLHKPYTARNYVPWAIFFVADSIWVALQIFEQVCPKGESRRRQPISCRARNRF